MYEKKGQGGEGKFIFVCGVWTVLVKNAGKRDASFTVFAQLLSC